MIDYSLDNFGKIGSPFLYRSNISSFSPTQLNGCNLWLDASDTSATNIVESSDLVSQWSDKSGQGNHFTNATGAQQPLTNTNTHNGLNVITFDGTDDFLENSSIASVFSGTDKELTIFCVYKASPTATTFQSPFGGRDSGNNTRIAISSRGTSYNKQLLWQRVNDAASANNLDTGEDVDGLFNLISVRQSGSDVIMNYNKDEVYNQADTYGSTTINNVGVGATVGTGSLNPLEGDVAEVIVYDRALTDAETYKVENYLYSKWGLFAPNELNNCLVWLDAADNTKAFVESGGSVSEWLDKSGQSHDVEQSTGTNQPTTEASLLNGLNITDYTTDDYLQYNYTAGDFDLTGIDQPFSVHIVFKCLATPVGNETIFSLTDQSDPGTRIYLANTDIGGGQFRFQRQSDNNDLNSAIVATSDTDAHVLNAVFDGTNIKVWLDGVVVLSADGFDTDDTSTFSRLTIGALDRASVAVADFFEGSIAEFVLYSGTQTESQVDKIYTYLSNKWNI